MYNNSVAKNHISEVAREGRYGDDMLVHMNKEEVATLAKAAGLEKLPINPQTGLPEAFAIMGALAIGKGILGAASAVGESKAAANQARAQQQFIGQQISEINEALGGLEGVKESKEGVAQQEFDQQLGFQAEETGIQKEDLQQQYQQAVQKSGLVTSGGVQQNKAQMYRRLQQSESRGQKSLVGKLGQSMASIEEWYSGEQSRLESEKKRLKHEGRVAGAQAASAKRSGIMGVAGAALGTATSLFGGG